MGPSMAALIMRLREALEGGGVEGGDTVVTQQATASCYITMSSIVCFHKGKLCSGILFVAYWQY